MAQWPEGRTFEACTLDITGWIVCFGGFVFFSFLRFGNIKLCELTRQTRRSPRAVVDACTPLFAQLQVVFLLLSCSAAQLLSSFQVSVVELSAPPCTGAKNSNYWVAVVLWWLFAGFGVGQFWPLWCFGPGNLATCQVNPGATGFVSASCLAA